ncbi:unnamed protein product [Cylicocyclus nassatus]|uniref:G-protein coupled receptors family 1 profile domain-containing protein n=1 Tax=Cylicocyclus nassatus TaxID=53992 RepID=A0AA36H0Q8_CYLNA|nr:unnamed protein product [Cylicocyclus nassatus]
MLDFTPPFKGWARCVAYATFYLSLLGHMVIVLYTLDAFHAEGEIESNHGLVAACFVTQWCRCSSLSIFPSVMLERYYASYHVTDYEAKPRKWVASLVITVSCILTTATAVPLIYVVYISLYRRDKKQVRYITSPLCTHYPLSARFQLAENLRVMKIVMYSSIVYSIWLVPPCIAMFLTYLYFKPTSAAGQICYATYEFFVSLSVLLLLVHTMVKSGRFFFTLCPKTVEHHAVDRHVSDRTTSMYFQQLTAAWKY